MMKAYAEAGADAILVGEPTGSMLSRKHAWEFMGKYLKEIIDACPVPVVLHICGNANHLLELMVHAGPAAIGLGKEDLPSLVPRIPPDIVIVGNIDPISVLEGGSPENERREVEELCDRMSHVPCYIYAPGLRRIAGYASGEPVRHDRDGAGDGPGIGDREYKAGTRRRADSRIA